MGEGDAGQARWKQWRKIVQFYRWCRARDVYLIVPDWYFLSQRKFIFPYGEGVPR
jgi:hypothetical protein